MTYHPTLGLCIPAYNAAWCLPRLLESAAQQEQKFDEILVYNDCSTDDTSAIAKQYGATVLEGEVNVGCSAGKNKLLEQAESEWIHFHDADDELMPNFTSLAHKWMALAETCPDVVLFDYEYRDGETKQLLSTRQFDGPWLRRDPIDYAIRNQINPFCGLYRRSKLAATGGYDIDPKILYNEDVAFHCKLAVAGLTFDAESEVSIINYRIAGSMSAANQLKCIQAHHAVMSELAKKVGGIHTSAVASRLWHAAGILATYDRWGEVDEALALAHEISPGSPKDASTLFATICRIIGQSMAFRLREKIIRRFKPHLRSNLD